MRGTTSILECVMLLACYLMIVFIIWPVLLAYLVEDFIKCNINKHSQYYKKDIKSHSITRGIQ